VFMLPSHTNIVPCRGRAGKYDTHQLASFTETELDQLAPLDSRDPKEMGEFCIPSSETIARVQRRIQAARRLKYGS
jgi:hypothetical protein